MKQQDMYPKLQPWVENMSDHDKRRLAESLNSPTATTRVLAELRKKYLREDLEGVGDDLQGPGG